MMKVGEGDCGGEVSTLPQQFNLGDMKKHQHLQSAGQLSKQREGGRARKQWGRFGAIYEGLMNVKSSPFDNWQTPTTPTCLQMGTFLIP